MATYITVEDGEVTRLFRRLLDVGDSHGITDLLRSFGNLLVDSTRARFRDSRAPDGSRWAPLSPVTIMLRRKGRGAPSGGPKPLLDTGRLRNSITSAVGGNTLVVGTNVVYAAMQHFGARKGEFGRYSQVSRVRKFGLGTFKGSAGTQRGFPIPWGNVPARPFLGVSSDDRKAMIDMLRTLLGETRS